MIHNYMDDLEQADDKVFIDSASVEKIAAITKNWHNSEDVKLLIQSKIAPMPCLRIVFPLESEPYEFLVNIGDKGIAIATKSRMMSLSYEDGIVGWNLKTTNEGPEAETDTKLAPYLLRVWYGIQLLHLNPRTDILFRSGKKERQYIREGSGKDRKRVVKYVRKHYITEEAVEKALGIPASFSRKTMAWSVIGHWRHYKNGNVKFIQGYWKGPLREGKKSLDGGRIRKLDI